MVRIAAEGKCPNGGCRKKRIKSFCGAKPTQKVRWTNAEVEVWAGLYEDFTADAWRLD